MTIDLYHKFCTLCHLSHMLAVPPAYLSQYQEFSVQPFSKLVYLEVHHPVMTFSFMVLVLLSVQPPILYLVPKETSFSEHVLFHLQEP